MIYFMYFIEIINLCLIHNALDLVIQLQSQNEKQEITTGAAGAQSMNISRKWYCSKFQKL